MRLVERLFWLIFITPLIMDHPTADAELLYFLTLGAAIGFTIRERYHDAYNR